MTTKNISELTFEELLENVEAIEQDFRLGKVTEEEVAEYIKAVATHLDIPIEPE